MSMAAPDKSFRVAGRLVKNPTSLAGSFPYGGDSLGDAIAGIIWIPGGVTKEIDAEEFAGLAVGYKHATYKPTLACVVRGLEDKMVETVFANTSVGGSGSVGVEEPGSFGQGSDWVSKAVKLLFVPRDTTNHPALILYRAIPLVDLTAEIALNIEVDVGFPMVWRGTFDGTSRLFEKKPLADITL